MGVQHRAKLAILSQAMAEAAGAAYVWINIEAYRHGGIEDQCSEWFQSGRCHRTRIDERVQHRVGN
jgi:hypothetical protein